MAVDSEARSSGNSAMVIALVAIILVAIGAFAFMNSNRTTEVVGVPGPSSTTTIVEGAPAAPAPDIKVESAPPVVVNGGSGTSGSSSTTTKTETTTSGGGS
ncbi:MAG TPA: hypothetical protein VGB77_22105 [Abditibacteriaceae bacterium]|jgi:N-acetyl-gamma-glutamylphosphate reductase